MMHLSRMNFPSLYFSLWSCADSWDYRIIPDEEKTVD
uniref:Uncharacterized protein n=1 Tax=Rhizophora mucronata TaxID=61149 RepID=A0A2P2K6W4_RHIMU